MTAAAPASAPRGRGLAPSAIAIAAFFFLIVLPIAAIPVIDGDAYWHIRAGDTVIDSMAVPRTDTWSIVGDGMRWVSQDWLSNVVLALVWRLGHLGPSIASTIWAALVVIGFWILWRAVKIRRPQAGWFGRIIWFGGALIVAGATIGVRVQVVDLPLAALVILVLSNYLATRRRAWLLVLPPLAVAWANLHAGWPFIFILGGAVVVGEGLDRMLGRRFTISTLTWRENAWLIASLAVSLAAIAINPNGVALYLYPFQTSAIPAHRDFLAEWQPPDIATFTGQAFVVFTLLLVVPVIALTIRRMRLADAFLLIGLTAMAASAARFLIAAPLVAAVAVLYAEPLLAETGIGRRFGPMLVRLATVRPAFSAINGMLVAIVVVIGLGVTWARINPDAQAALIARNMPVQAVDWILAHDPGARPFNQYSWGGYLGLMRPDDPIYIDGRSDIYGDAPIRRYAETVRLERDPQAVFDEDRIDYVLFDVHQPLAEWLDTSKQWHRVYADDLAGVWVRR
jgi:hypothetical protein